MFLRTAFAGPYVEVGVSSSVVRFLSWRRWERPMLIGYVSDERYVALPDVLLEFRSKAGSFETRSRAYGAVFAELPAGAYDVTLWRPGFGSKSLHIQISDGAPYQ